MRTQAIPRTKLVPPGLRQPIVPRPQRKYLQWALLTQPDTWQLWGAGCSKRKKIMVPAIPVSVVDTVGAGDRFDAGFIYGYLQGWPLEKDLRVDIICGTLSTREVGGTAA